MSDPNDLAAFLDEAWQHLQRGVADSRAPTRFPTFATVSPDGIPQARTVALRGAHQSTASVDVHTDIETPKVTELWKNPFAALHVWIPGSDLQIRLTAHVDILTGEVVEEHWAKVPVNSRVSYGTNPIPGVPIEHVYDYEKPAERARFAVLRCALTHIDLVHLGTKHRRAKFVREDNWQGCWLSP